MRKLRWDHGRAWLAGRAIEWLPAIEMPDQQPLARVHTFSVPATSQAADTAVAVELKNFTASSGSYFARLGGELRADTGAQLRVTLRLPVDCYGAGDIVQAVAAGIAGAPEHPRGNLDLRIPYVHPIEFKPRMWERCSATMLQLMAADVVAMSDDAASTAGRSAAAWRDAPAPAIPVTPALFVADDTAALMQMVADRIRGVAAEATLIGQNRFRIALAGGSTPRQLYPHLTDTVDWKRADVFFGDERAVPPDDPQSNYRMARETLLAPARVPDANVFRWRAESPDLDAAARDYAQALQRRPAPVLDLALLGLGPDGHTASLFPGTTALDVADRLAVAVDVPAMGARRLTLTYPVFLEAGEVFFLVTGRDKRAALADVLRPESTLPAARIAHRARSTRIFCDREAAQDINPPA